MPATFRCRLCCKTFVLDDSMVAVCPTCCDTLVEPVEDNLYENAEVACEIQEEFTERRCNSCHSTVQTKLSDPVCRCSNPDFNEPDLSVYESCEHCNSYDHYSYDCPENDFE